MIHETWMDENQKETELKRLTVMKDEPALEMRAKWCWMVMKMMAEMVWLQGVEDWQPPLFPQTWWSLSLPFLPGSKQFDAREDVQLAGLVVCAFAVARAAAAAACVRLLALPCLPLLADQGAGDRRCPGHASTMKRNQTVRPGWRECSWTTRRERGGKGSWGSTPPTTQFSSHTGRCRLADFLDLKR